MKRIGKTIGVMLVLILAHAGICFCGATPAESSFVLTPLRSSFKVEFGPTSHPAGSGPVDLQFQVRSLIGCDKATVTVASVDKLEYSGPMSWVAEFEEDSTYSTIFQVVIPPNDTSKIEIKVEGCGDQNQGPLYFVTTGDTIEVTPGNPRGYQSIPYTPKTDEIIKDTLTQEHLQAEYKVLLDLRNSTNWKIAERILGKIPESSRFRGHDGYYILSISLENLFKLRDAEIDIEFTAPPPWSRKYSPPKDSVRNKQPESDTVKKQGILERRFNLISPDGISLDSIDGMTTPGQLPAGEEITFCLRLNNNSGYNIIGSTNGFRVYSPTGAQWEPLTWDTTSVGWGNMYNQFFFNDYGVTGSGADTIGFGGFKILEPGIPNGFDEVAFLISTQIDAGYDGHTLCLDSSWYPPVMTWVWSLSTTPAPTNYYPSWDGPHCFTIENDITFTGYLYYLDPVPPDTNQMPMRRIRIEMWDEDFLPLDPHDSLAIAITDDNGYFNLGPVANEDGLLGGNLDIFFRIYAENEAAYVTESYNGDIHRIQTAVGDDLPSGVYDTTIVAPLDSSGAFYIADVVLEGYNKWLVYRPDDEPGDLQVVLNTTVETGFDTVHNYIGINDSVNDLNWTPDTFDRDVILHEYGHWLSYAFDYFDISPGGTHYWWMKVSPEFAATEAFGHVWSAVVRSDVIQRNWWNDFNNYYDVNIENGEYGYNGSMSHSANAHGDSCEAAVAGMLWDIYDNANDDYSGSVDWGVTTIPHHPDGIWDTLSNGIGNILTVLLDCTVNGHHPDNIDEFWEAWFGPPGFDHVHAMVDIWYEHGEQMIQHCCNHDGMRGDFDGTNTIDVGDMTSMVAYLFQGGQLPVCFEEGDIDGNGDIDVGDLTYLVAFLFQSGPPPPACP